MLRAQDLEGKMQQVEHDHQITGANINSSYKLVQMDKIGNYFTCFSFEII
jgi:hypothetical protein